MWGLFKETLIKAGHSWARNVEGCQGKMEILGKIQKNSLNMKNGSKNHEKYSEILK